MKNSIPLRHRVMWLALATFGTLILLPGTRYLFRTQVQMASLHYSAERDLSAERALGSQRPDDYPIQLALATDVPPLSLPENRENSKSTAASVARDRQIQALTQQFPNNPSSYANLLRYMTLSDVKLWYGNPGTEPSVSSGFVTPTAELLAMFDAAAQKGAELDPDNAYFPMMRAIGLFVAHREGEAQEALKTAGRCTQWREYYSDDIEGRMRLQKAVYGDRLAVQEMSTLFELLFPHYSQLRATARAAVHLAAEDERTGKVTEGLALRHALMHCGGLMRAQGVSAISSLVGIAIANIATQEPGGIKVAPQIDPGKSKGEESQQVRDQRIAERRNRYYTYLENQGQSAEAVWAGTEIAAGDQAKAILSEGAKNPVNSGWRYAQFSFSWIVGMVLLLSALVLLALGVMAHQAHFIRPGKSWAIKLLPVLQCSFALLCIAWIGVRAWAAVGHGLEPISDISYLSEMYNVSSAPDQPASVQFGVLSLSLTIPLLLVGFLAALSRHQRVPVATGLGRGLRGAAIPLAAATFVLYGVSLLPTVCLESIIKTDIARTAHNEPQYWAEIAHKSWPGNPRP